MSDDAFILLGPPVDQARWAALGIKAYTPPPLSTQAACALCGCKVWLGPRQSAMVGRATVCCFSCAAAGVSRDRVQSLGGQSGKYTTFSPAPK